MDIEAIRQDGKKAKGRRELIRFLEGKRLTGKQTIEAKCFECMCGYTDGKHDCKCYDCPLYPYMPYREYKCV